MSLVIKIKNLSYYLKNFELQSVCFYFIGQVCNYNYRGFYEEKVFCVLNVFNQVI